ncbi:MAG: hydrogenase expression/formation protein HypE [Candidatus Delongbacteria bacterium]
MSESECVTLGHGAGGRLTRRLVEEILLPAYGNPWLAPLGDSALLEPVGRLAFTSDGYVVTPRFFPGGDIGSLAVNGTVNDLAVAGATPLYLSLALILEEGLPLDELRRVAASVGVAARRAGVTVVTGDTKVVEHGQGDGLYLVSSGIGRLRPNHPRADRGPAAGDAILVSGPVGDHGAVILSLRRGIELESPLHSDCAPVTPLVDALFAAGVAPLFLRDPTRGGLGGVLSDLAGEEQARPAYGVEVEEARIPLHAATAAICEITGVDPLLLACEGRVVVVVEAADIPRALAAWRALPAGAGAECVGRLTTEHPGQVVLRNALGGRRALLRPSADPLPRIC